MEKISIKSIRWFYVIMLIMLILETINTLILGDCLIEEIILGILSATNFVLFGYVLLCNVRQHYYQGKFGCKILQWTMGAQMITFMISHALICTCGWYMIVQNLIIFFLIELILSKRIKDIEYLETLVREEGRQWII